VRPARVEVAICLEMSDIGDGGEGRFPRPRERCRVQWGDLL